MLSPAYDINPVPNALGLNLNISEYNNELDLDLAREVAEQFSIWKEKREQIIKQVCKAVENWREVASGVGISPSEMARMEI